MRSVFLFLTMQTFLDDFVKYYSANFDLSLKNQTIILPSKRSVAALKKTFTNHFDTLWLPEITDILSFIKKVSQIEILDHQESILEFYKVYSSLHKENQYDSYENYYSWASVLINDFNEIDRFLINPEHFFKDNKSIKTLNYFGEEKTEMIKSYIKFWEKLPLYYSTFKNHCLKINKASQGLAYRMASEKIYGYIEEYNNPIIFLGFNALNKAEEQIVECCLKQKIGYLVWDIDQNYLSEPTHPANTFIVNYQKKWSSYRNYLVNLKSALFSKPKQITIHSSSRYVGQAKAVANILQSSNFNDSKKTAVILNDENLLFPILNSLPDNVHEVNITMGLTLNKSPITDFINLLIAHQVKHKDELSNDMMSQLIHHQLLFHIDNINLNPLIYFIDNNEAHKYFYNDFDTIFKKDSIEHLFLSCLKLYSTPVEFIEAIIKFIGSIQISKPLKFEVYLKSYQNIFLRLYEIIKSNPNLSHKAVEIIFKDLEESEKLSFQGSKDSGLQIMGMLESRLLDFETIIFTSVNEGILPAGKTDNSYITYDLKKQYSMPTHTEKDAIYAYHFFRLFQRAEHCHIIYDNDQTGFNKGEKSRFLSYLEIFKSKYHKINSKDFHLSTKLKKNQHLEVQKTPEILNKLKDLIQNGLSSTALTTYILNPILFYKRYILKVKEPETKDDTINHRDFGTLIHSTVEELYKNISNLNYNYIEECQKVYPSILKTKFDLLYVQDSFKKGANRIKFEIAKASLDRFFNQEKKFQKNSDLEIVDIEKPVECLLKIDENTIKLKGYIDRIDKYDNELRIIDLKTGKVEPKNLKFKDFNHLITDYDYAKAFQVLFYALIYSKNFNVDQMKAGIISFKNLNSWFMPLNFNGKTTIDDSILIEFEHYLHQLINEILDPNIPFKEKDVNFES